jgi:hypothetical protein
VGCLVDCPECRCGDSHSPAGPAELTCLAWVCCSYYVTMIAIFLYPRTHLTLLRYLYTEILLLRYSLNYSACWLHTVKVRVKVLAPRKRDLSICCDVAREKRASHRKATVPLNPEAHCRKIIFTTGIHAAA